MDGTLAQIFFKPEKNLEFFRLFVVVKDGTLAQIFFKPEKAWKKIVPECRPLLLSHICYSAHLRVM